MINTYSITMLYVCLLMYPLNVNAQSVISDPNICNYMISHQTDNDVTYKPGIDVEGKAVKPAELKTSHSIQAPDIIEFPLTISLDQFLETAGISEKLEMETKLETITIEMKTGKVTYGGKDITSDLQNYCHESTHHIKSGTEPAKTGPKLPKPKPSDLSGN